VDLGPDQTLRQAPPDVVLADAEQPGLAAAATDGALRQLAAQGRAGPVGQAFGLCHTHHSSRIASRRFCPQPVAVSPPAPLGLHDFVWPGPRP